MPLAALLAPLLLAFVPQEKPTAPPAADPSWRPAQLELPALGDRFPFELARSRPIPVVEAWIDGHGPFRFFLDTGAALTVVDEVLARRLGLELGDEVPIGDSSDAERVRSHRIRLEELRLGRTLLRGVPAVAMDRARFGGVEGVRGVLGLPLFQACLFTLDYPRSRIDLAAGRLPAADGEELLDYELRSGTPLLTLHVDERPIELRIDSGAPSGITLPRAFAQDLSWKQEPRVRGLGRTVNNEFEIWQGVLDGQVRLGGHVFEDPVVNLNEEIPRAFLGYRSLRSFELTIDQRERRLRLHAPAAGPGPRR